MATLDRVWRSPASAAASRALDADIDASLDGRELHPDGTVFIPEDVATPQMIETYRRDGSHVAVVSEGGSIQLLRPRRRSEEKFVIAVVVAAILLWLARSRSAVMG